VVIVCPLLDMLTLLNRSHEVTTATTAAPTKAATTRTAGEYNNNIDLYRHINWYTIKT